MAKYKVIFRSDNKNAGTAPGWEPGCPVLINAVQVSRNTETGQCYLQLKLSNLTDEAIGRFALRVEVTYADGATEAVELKPLDADIQPGHAYRPDAVPLAGSDVQHVSARIVSATYGNEHWATSGETLAISSLCTDEPLELSPTAAAERRLVLTELGKNPKDYERKMIQSESWWLCPCGMLNVRRDSCCTCGLTRQTIEHLEDNARLSAAASERKETDRRRKRKRIIASCVAIGAIVAILTTSAVTNYIIYKEQNARVYQIAVELQESGNYRTAYERFNDVIDYKDARERAAECARLADERDKK